MLPRTAAAATATRTGARRLLTRRVGSQLQAHQQRTTTSTTINNRCRLEQLAQRQHQTLAARALSVNAGQLLQDLATRTAAEASISLEVLGNLDEDDGT